MNYDELKDIVFQYFGDKSRPASETREDLRALAEECETLAESIPRDDAE